MTMEDKLLRKFLDNPGSLRFGKIEKILSQMGFDLVSIDGSHWKYKHPLISDNLVVPVHGRDCKNKYKLKIAKIIKEKFYG